MLLAVVAPAAFPQTATSSLLTAGSVRLDAATVKVKTPVTAKEAKANFLRQPLSFEATSGQATPTASYVSRGRGYTLILSGVDSTFVLPGSRSGEGQFVLSMQLADADNAVTPHAEKPLQGRSNYFLGNNPSEWRRGVEQFAQMRLSEVYPGIDLIYYGNQRQLEHDFVVSPGADPDRIRMKFSGAASQAIGKQGNLLMKTLQGQSISFEKPFAWQTMADGSRHSVSAEYSLLADRHMGFRLGHFDPALTLTIDPVVITYSTYFGGSGLDSVDDIKVDAQGNIYLLMTTTSVNLLVVSQIPSACVGICGADNSSTPDQTVISHDIYLAKLNPTGQQLLYSTYIGGSADALVPEEPLRTVAPSVMAS